MFEDEPESRCIYCGMEWQTIRPGKEQPNCDCYDRQYNTLIIYHRHDSLYYFLEVLTRDEVDNIQSSPEVYLYAGKEFRYSEISDPARYRQIFDIIDCGIERIAEAETLREVYE